MNQFTIEFKNPKDLADKISKYNDLMNPKPISELAVNVAEEKPAKPTVKKAAKEAPAVVADPVVEAAPVEVEAPTVEPEPVADPEPVEAEPAVEAAADVPVTDFNGEPIAEDPTELDVEPAAFDPAAYWVDFKSWLKSIGNDGIKKALEVFRSHGVQGNPSSDDLTPEIVAELDALMKGE